MDAGPVKIFTIRDVPRFRYIAELILGEILGLSWEIVTDKRKLGKNPVINYSAEDINGSLKIQPHGLLSETGLKSYDPEISEWKGLPVFFQTPGADIPFDIFAASFFLVSRYEEYLVFEPDQFGRYSASRSFAYRNKFLSKPVIDLWSRELAKSLLSRFQNMTFKRNKFRSLLTIDVDQPFAYLGKDFFRSLGGLLKDVSRDTGKVAERYRTVARGEKDPYDVFDYIFEAVEKNEPDVHFFIPTGDHSAYDKNPSWQNEVYRKLIKLIYRKYSIGLHPSFAASDNASILLTEKRRLHSIVSKDIMTSRFHYIKMSFPGSFRNLISAGITEDYSMGYPDEPGFRAGIARPFYFYDIHEEKKTSLRITPFQVMDGTFFRYKGITPPEADEIIANMISETRNAGGLFVSIWHNTSLLNNPEWQKWRDTFELMLKLQQP
ncbi:MAG: hypothetical protein C0408_05425 [Odoribacter sp.]|nr:hypothetical protein [Odoribacter sp.]